jgi:hypothetical protein
MEPPGAAGPGGGDADSSGAPNICADEQRLESWVRSHSVTRQQRHRNWYLKRGHRPIVHVESSYPRACLEHM